MTASTDSYAFDRFLRHGEMADWLGAVAREHAGIASLSTYGRSHEGRDLFVMTITDTSTGPHGTKPAMWVDANIHSIEVTGGVAALHLIHRLVTGFAAGDTRIVEALRTRTFYVAPRVNPDGVEAALADSPRYRRSSMRPWPWTDRHRWPGLEVHDIDGNGRILTMRIPDEHGAWVEHPQEPRLMIPVDHELAPAGVPRWRLLSEGTLSEYDGFTVPTPRPVEGLDMNRNFPSGWGTAVTGSGDHPMSEPEIDALVRAVSTRPNICGYNAYHTSGGFLLRPSSTKPDSSLPPEDVWTFKEIGRRCTALSTYPVHSVYEDFTWDKSDTMSGAADDWAYDHLGVYSWTTEFWDAIAAATDHRSSTHIWYVGPTVEDELAVIRWADTHAPGEVLPWAPFDHPQLGPVEIGGMDAFRVWSNAPSSVLRAEVAPHAEFAVHQALLSPRLEILRASAERLSDGMWRVEVGIANTGWLPTHVTELARKNNLCLPGWVQLQGADPVGSPARATFGNLAGRSAQRLTGGIRNDGTPDRHLHSWVVRAAADTTVTITASHERAGTVSATVLLG
ncbi:MAG: M14 family metallopeptidase [Acidimicrobiales bacterium]